MDAETPARHHAIEIDGGEIARRRLDPEHFRVAALLLHTQGFVILKRAVPADIAAAAGREFRRIFEDCVGSREGDSWYQVARQTQAVFWERNCRWRIFPKLRPPFDSPWIIAHPFADELLRFFLDDDYYCKFISSDTCLKGAVIQSPHRELGAGRSWEPRSYIVNIPLCRSSLENGPLEIWPSGSHLWRNDVLGKLGWNDGVQDGRNPEAEWFATLLPSRRVVLEPGDVLIRDPGLLHRGTVNHTDEPRSMLTVCYFRRGLTHDYGEISYNLDRAMWEALEPSARRRFAHAFEGEGIADGQRDGAGAAPPPPANRRAY